MLYVVLSLILFVSLSFSQIVAMAVIIFGFWNVPVIRNFINPLKLFTIGWHELCHISAVCIYIYMLLLPSNSKSIDSILGNFIRRTNIENHHRSTRWWRNYRRGWSSWFCLVIGIYRFYPSGRCIRSGRVGYPCGQNSQFCSRCRTGYASSSRS
jgi:hypothetical protein